MAKLKKIVHKISKLNEDEFVRKMCKEKKARKIGSGCFGTVYGSRSLKTVFKTGDVDDNDGYLAFIEHALKHQSNPWFPKIKNVTIYRSTKEEFHSYFVIEMERLNELKRADEGSDVVELLDAMIDSDKVIAKLFARSMGKVALQHITTLGKVMRILFDRHCHDLHSGNIMKRDNGQIVVTDPVC